MSDKTNWDTEQVLAFVHDVRPWRDMDDAEKAEWCRRVKHIRDNVVTGGEPWTNARLAVLFGLRITGLEDRFRRSGAKSDPGAQQTTWADRRTRIEEQAKAEAEAKAKAEQEALTRKHREEMLAERQRTEREQKAQAERIRQEEQAKAAENARREIEVLRAQLTKAAEKAEFDVSTLTEKQKAEVMTLLANDPEQAREWFSAQNKERARKLQEESKKAKDAADRRRSQMEDRERREAEKRASKEYEDSALYFYLEEVMPIVEELRHRVSRKPVTLEHVIRSGRTAQDIVNRTETMEDVAVTVREAVFLANAAAELEYRSR